MESRNIASLLKHPTEKDIALVRKAYDFALHAHKDQTRNSGEPYSTHLIETARILAELGLSGTTVSAGLLHDSVEDVGITPETIEKEFGAEIRFLVEGVTKLGHLKYRESTRHAESLRKLFVAMSKDIRVLLVKLADRLHNMRTLQHVPKEKQIRIAKETLEIYAPIAYRLGIRKVSRELEDLAFAYVYPAEYETVSDIVKQKEGLEMTSLEKFLKSLKKELATNGLTHFHTDYRIKGLYSLYKKLQRMDIDRIYDLAAVRVVVSDISDCYKTLGIIHSIWRPLPGRIKDYIAFPKPNGYQSLHTTIFTGDGSIVEVQIRTAEMDRESEYGITSHISYKQKTNEHKHKTTPQNFSWVARLLPRRSPTDTAATGEKPSVNLDDVPIWVKDLVEYQKEKKDESFLEDIKADFFEERIFVFTPKGDVIDLPRGSSAIDFAYSVHSDIGNHMSGAKINGKFVAISTELQNGDCVEIETKQSAKPNRKWLDHVKTTMAKKHIRIALAGKV